MCVLAQILIVFIFNIFIQYYLLVCYIKTKFQTHNHLLSNALPILTSKSKSANITFINIQYYRTRNMQNELHSKESSAKCSIRQLSIIIHPKSFINQKILCLATSQHMIEIRVLLILLTVQQYHGANIYCCKICVSLRIG